MYTTTVFDDDDDWNGERRSLKKNMRLNLLLRRGVSCLQIEDTAPICDHGFGGGRRHSKYTAREDF